MSRTIKVGRIVGIVWLSVVCAPAVARDATDHSGFDVRRTDSRTTAEWNAGAGRRGRLTLNTDGRAALIGSLSLGEAGGDEYSPVLRDQEPVVRLTVGQRNLAKRKGWTIFFDKTPDKPFRQFRSSLKPVSTITERTHERLRIKVGGFSVGPFEGTIDFVLYDQLPIVHVQAVVQSEDNGLAILYDAGLVSHSERPQRFVRIDSRSGDPTVTSVEPTSPAQNFAVRFRTVAAESSGGSVALFPPPHRYFYPLDFSDNLANMWAGAGFGDESDGFGFGVRHDPRGDRRWVPWFNAPPGTNQELEWFLHLSTGDGIQAIKEVQRYTRDDRFEPLPGHVTFSSHYHVEHTTNLLDRQAEADDDALTVTPASGRRYRVPDDLVEPGFVRTFKRMGVEIVHLGEFHFGRTPRLRAEERLPLLEMMHSECRRLSDESFLLLPGEEPNVHLGGHWMSFFPRPVYWILNRPEGVPLRSDHPDFGTVYHVGNANDVRQLFESEGGLAWTAHARIKGSTGFPDRYRHTPMFQSPSFLGAAWKAMPADLSQRRLGGRVIDLLDDMSNWHPPKYAIGEVDVFKIEPDHELYGHMNINYLRLDAIPRFDDGWQPVLDALRHGRFFVSTGEVLVRDFTVNGRRSGETVPRSDGPLDLRLELDWTFPLSHARIVSGNGAGVFVRTIDLADTEPFGRREFRFEFDARDRHWVRFEVWDIATNGAFTQPVWIDET